MADLEPLHDGRGLRPDRHRGDRPHSQHHDESRLIMPSGHPGNYTSLTDVTFRDRRSACVALAGGDVDRGEDRLYRADPERVGQEGRGRQRSARGRADPDSREDDGARTGEPRAALGERDSAEGFSGFCVGGARLPVEVMIDFIDDHRREHGVEPICNVLPIAPSTYYDHLARQADPARR